MAVSSIPAFRRRFFTVFAMLHRLWPLFVGSAIVHIPSFAWPTIPALALYIIDRVACLWTATPGAAGAATVTTTAVRVNDDVVALLIPVGPARGSTVDSGELDNVLLHMYTPGRFLSLSYPMDAINVTHPFSIAAYSAPNRTVSVMIRAVGSWTRKLHSFATKDGAAVELRVEGPFSMPAMHVDSHWAATGSDAVTDNNLTVIAGGVGISKYLMHPTNPLLESSDSLASIQKPTASERITDTAVESSGSLSTVRKLWLCKDDTEMAMYLALGADLSDWAAFSSHGFARILEETGIHEKYPLFEQYNVSVPLQRSARLLMFLTLVAMYFGIYVVVCLRISSLNRPFSLPLNIIGARGASGPQCQVLRTKAHQH
ncbi:hypothetical protein BC828DRAFT_130583 [Blastocladiella britannica]|nr:hypothetical protein BC828DRAFT_130583 [Blastocladiella britannica]